jgi:glycine cleavage system H lipoate-binding protein
MLIIEGFNGYRIEIPEDRYFLPGPELWIQAQGIGKTLVLGLTQAGVVLAGGIVSLEFLIEEGQLVSPGDVIAFAVTNKVKYIETPLPGNILSLNSSLVGNLHLFQEDPYGKAWIFSLRPSGTTNLADYFLNAISYQQRLLRSEACGNPKGLKGGLSPTCRTIYSSLRSQKQG